MHACVVDIIAQHLCSVESSALTPIPVSVYVGKVGGGRHEVGPGATAAGRAAQLHRQRGRRLWPRRHQRLIRQESKERVRSWLQLRTHSQCDR